MMVTSYGRGRENARVHDAEGELGHRKAPDEREDVAPTLEHHEGQDERDCGGGYDPPVADAGDRRRDVGEPIRAHACELPQDRGVESIGDASSPRRVVGDDLPDEKGDRGHQPAGAGGPDASREGRSRARWPAPAPHPASSRRSLRARVIETGRLGRVRTDRFGRHCKPFELSQEVATTATVEPPSTSRVQVTEHGGRQLGGHLVDELARARDRNDRRPRCGPAGSRSPRAGGHGRRPARRACRARSRGRW